MSSPKQSHVMKPFSISRKWQMGSDLGGAEVIVEVDIFSEADDKGGFWRPLFEFLLWLVILYNRKKMHLFRLMPKNSNQSGLTGSYITSHGRI